MASVACQDMQSCLDPRFIEPFVLKHKMTPPNSTESHNSLQENKNLENSHNENLDLENDNKNCKFGGGSFIKALTNIPQICNKQTHVQNVYVHPLDKSTSPMLSPKSLEMCTENLGSETGSDISESSEEFSYLTYETKKIKGTQCAKKPTFSASFPPPLTSIGGTDGVRVRPHREGGRLVIQVVSISPTYTYFQADRSNGRLTLSLSKDCNLEEEYNGEEVEEGKENEHVDKFEEEEEEEELEGDNDDDDFWVEVMEGNSEIVGYENGNSEIVGYENRNNENVGYENGNSEELARPRRCKENNGKGMSIWGPYCVAIS